MEDERAGLLGRRPRRRNHTVGVAVAMCAAVALLAAPRRGVHLSLHESDAASAPRTPAGKLRIPVLYAQASGTGALGPAGAHMENNIAILSQLLDDDYYFDEIAAFGNLSQVLDDEPESAEHGQMWP